MRGKNHLIPLAVLAVGGLMLSTPLAASAASFADVTAGTPHAAEIGWLADNGIATGYADGTFRPMGAVTRADMAAFLHRAAKGAPDGGRPASFADVDASTPHAADVAWLASHGIATGYADGTFRPSAPVNRQDMAAFLHRFAAAFPQYAKAAPADGAPVLRDVTADTPHADDIRWAASAGVAAGYADGTYRGGEPVVRADMAAFVKRTVTGERADNVQTGSRYTIEDLKGVQLVWAMGSDLTVHVADGFDYRNPGPYYMPYGDTHAGIRYLPAGWRTEDTQQPNEADNWHVIAPDGTVVITYRIGRGYGPTQPGSTESSIVAYVNGARFDRWNPDGNTSYDSTVIGRYDYDLAAYPNAVVSFGNLPAGWTADVSSYGSTVSVSFRGTVNNQPYVTRTYTFRNSTYSATTGQTPAPQPEPQAPEGYRAVYRAYNGREHFYTASAQEYGVITRNGWRGEGIAFYQPTQGQPVYRAYHPGIGMHFYTASKHEYDVITTSQGWRAEGVAWNVDNAASGQSPVYRAYNRWNGEHLFTMSKVEYDHITANGWRAEGVAWYAKGK
ncbi:S-layer homology domain-containing protein [Bifidobacterium myosotis]|uniref:S-layer homology domain-containing protein n=1 Tax=Bifidobacterium myosotis TaxID=1630166 RepID=A0A5M9ZJ46_9BIFI|nr:S-layer homology domain-containing protein [Bifidobacterium myosotis]KAA8826942.1 S-layer homology domain-containing protein [Bifidobacterium myosotis]